MEPRSPKKSEWKSIDQFLTSQLRPSEGWSLQKEYPLAFAEKNLGNIRIICDEKDQILSHAVLKTKFDQNPVPAI